MTDLLIRDLDPDMQRLMEQRARLHDRDVSDEAKALLREGLGLPDGAVEPVSGPPPGMGMGTWMFSLVPEEFRGDDLIFEIDGPDSPPPDFK